MGSALLLAKSDQQMAKDKAVYRMFTCQRVLDLLFKPSERVLFPFAIDEWYIDIKNTE